MSIFNQLLILCLLAGLGYAGFEAYQRQLPQETAQTGRPPARPVSVELATAEIQRVARTVEAVGTTRAKQSIAIVPGTDGRVREMAIAPGQSVKQGDVIVQMDDTIESADLAEAKARVTEQTLALERVSQLRSTNAVSQASLEDTTARLAEARAQLDRAQQRYVQRTITAPFDGVVGLAEIDLGAWITAGERITTLDDLSEVVIEFSLPETLFAAVQAGQPIFARSAAFPGREFSGDIMAVDSRIDPIGRSFRTRAVLPNPDRLLPAGMFMSLTLTLSEQEAVVVPESAIVFEAAQTYVFTVTDNIATRIPVTTGQRRRGQVAILSGLEPGTQVITGGLQRVRDGGDVSPVESDLTSQFGNPEGDT